MSYNIKSSFVAKRMTIGYLFGDEVDYSHTKRQNNPFQSFEELYKILHRILTLQRKFLSMELVDTEILVEFETNSYLGFDIILPEDSDYDELVKRLQKDFPQIQI
jgi:hypothetical protein